jgi:hypothetical protein
MTETFSVDGARRLGLPPTIVPEPAADVVYSCGAGTVTVTYAKVAGALARTVHRYAKPTGELTLIAAADPAAVRAARTTPPTAHAVADAARAFRALVNAERAAHENALETTKAMQALLASRDLENARAELEKVRTRAHSRAPPPFPARPNHPALP